MMVTKGGERGRAHELDKPELERKREICNIYATAMISKIISMLTVILVLILIMMIITNSFKITFASLSLH